MKMLDHINVTTLHHYFYTEGEKVAAVTLAHRSPTTSPPLAHHSLAANRPPPIAAHPLRPHCRSTHTVRCPSH